LSALPRETEGNAMRERGGYITCAILARSLATCAILARSLARWRLRTVLLSRTAPRLSFTKTNLSRQCWTSMRKGYESQLLPDYGACVKNRHWSWRQARSPLPGYL